jgi:hypothetical protein
MSILLVRVVGFRKGFLEALKVAQYKSNWGLFIDSCFNHCQTPFRITWHSPISLRLSNKVSEVQDTFNNYPIKLHIKF